MSFAPPALSTPVKQFSVFLHNKVGALLEIVKILNECNVEVIGLSVLDSVDSTVVRLIVSDPEEVSTIFKEIGVPFSTVDLIVVELVQGAFGLADCLSTLLMAETNIHFSYPLLTSSALHPALALFLEDADVGVSVLLSNGFKLLCQDDLSR